MPNESKEVSATDLHPVWVPTAWSMRCSVSIAAPAEGRAHDEIGKDPPVVRLRQRSLVLACAAVSCAVVLIGCNGGHGSSGSGSAKFGVLQVTSRDTKYGTARTRSRRLADHCTRGADEGARVRRRARLADPVPLDRSLGTRHRGERSRADSNRTASRSGVDHRRVGARHDRARRSMCTVDCEGSRARFERRA